MVSRCENVRVARGRTAAKCETESRPSQELDARPNRPSARHDGSHHLRFSTAPQPQLTELPTPRQLFDLRYFSAQAWLHPSIPPCSPRSREKTTQNRNRTRRSPRKTSGTRITCRRQHHSSSPSSPSSPCSSRSQRQAVVWTLLCTRPHRTFRRAMPTSMSRTMTATSTAPMRPRGLPKTLAISSGLEHATRVGA